MVLPGINGRNRRFQAALILSLLFHGVVGVAGARWMSGRTSESEDREMAPAPLFSSLQEKEGGTEFVYVETTGDILQLSRNAGSSPPVAGAGGEQLSVLKEESAVPLKNGVSALEGSQDQALQPYLNQLRGKIAQAVRSSGDIFGGEVFLHFVLDKNGSLKSVGLISGKNMPHVSLQEKALLGVKSAAPFPPLPEAWPKRNTSFTIRLIFPSREFSG